MERKIFNVIEYGAVADGETLNSVAVQKAIDECFVCGGGEVVFQRGKYVLSTVFLKSNVRIFLEKGAEILGSLNFYDYCPDEKVDYPLYQDVSHSFFDCSMFVAKDLENVAICIQEEPHILARNQYRIFYCLSLYLLMNRIKSTRDSKYLII